MTRRTATVLLALVWIAHVTLHLADLPRRPVSACFHDEALYVQQARDIADGGVPRHNRFWQAKYPPLYSLALAPVWKLNNADDFAWWSRMVNILLLGSLVIPIYRLARFDASRGWALAAAALALLAGYQITGRYLLSESLQIPLFAWFALATVRLCGRPATGRAVVVGLLLGSLILTKTLNVLTAVSVVAAVWWATRSLKQTVMTGGLTIVSAALLVVPWQFRSRLFSSEAAVAPLFSYFDELAVGGVQSPAVYLYWLRAQPGLFVIALGSPFLVLAVYGLLVWGREKRPVMRGFAAFMLITTTLSVVMVAGFIAQTARHSDRFVERYFWHLWPLLIAASTILLAKTATRRGAMAVATLMVVVLVAAMPDRMFSTTSPLFEVIESPSKINGSWLGDFGLPFRARLLCLAPLVIIPGLFGARHHLAAGTLVVLMISYQTYTVHSAFARADILRSASEPPLDRLWSWLDEIIQPDDIVLHHHMPWGLTYQNTIRYGIDIGALNGALEPRWHEKSATFDRVTGRYTPVRQSGSGRMFIFTNSPGPSPPAGGHAFDEYRLLPIDDGLASLGQWLGAPPAEPVIFGASLDGWSEARMTVDVPVDYPGQFEVTMVVEHPVDSPVSGPLSLHFQLVEGTAASVLKKGSRHVFHMWMTVWTPMLRLTITADHAAELDGRQVAFKIKAFRVKKVKGFDN